MRQLTATHSKALRIGTLLAASLLLSACLSTSGRYTSSSAVDFLYPDSEQTVVAEATPHLRLPLRIGIAFTPDDAFRQPDALTARTRSTLLDQIAERFRREQFVSAIEVVPQGYLRRKGGFDNLDQVASILNLDVVALVSYDQHHFSDEGFASIAYWTLIGAYIVPGEKNTTHTLMDAVLVDVDSRSMLFRAPGSSTVKGRSTPIAVSGALRNDSEEGFQLASTQLIDNLDGELERLKTRIRNRESNVQVSGRDSYRGEGAGSLGPTLIILIGVLALLASRRR